MDGKTKKKIGGKIITFVIIIAVLIIAIIVFLLIDKKVSKESEIINKVTLEKIINVSDLSTFEAVYNGITEVMNDEEPEKIDYYVSYDSKVKAGIDFANVEVTVDDEDKVITVKLPEIKITDVNVDITSLDYIFENDKADTSTVSEKAYKRCIEDVKSESSSEKAIYELAEQNARNIVEALISPFVEQLDAEYQLQIS